MPARRYHAERLPIPLPSRLRKELRLHGPPWWMVILLIFTLCSPLVPISFLLYQRTKKFSQPRIHLVQDMGTQPRYGAQASNPAFLDGRSMRMPVEGTIARGTLTEEHFDRGYKFGKDTAGNATLVFFNSIPDKVKSDANLLVRGKVMFNVYCLPCHGETGTGHGPINERALSLPDSKWVQASDLMAQQTRDREDGFIFSAITNGVRSMPPYSAQIAPRDRWMIVAYLRDLQKNSPVSTPSTKTTSASSASPVPAAGTVAPAGNAAGTAATTENNKPSEKSAK